MTLRLFSLLLSLAALLAPLAATAQSAAPAPPAAAPAVTVFSTAPAAKPGGGKWRIGYVESGEYFEYPRTLRAIAAGLQQLGWVELPAIPENLNGREMWDFLVRNGKSDTLEFVPDAWWQPANASQRAAVRQAIGERLARRHDIDLIIAMGTWAGQDMAALGAPVPTIAASVSDPIGSGIVKSAADSGLDNLHAPLQIERYQRQVRLFHQIVPFKTLGLVYEDSPEGRTYAAVPAVEQVASEQHFEIKACHAPFNNIPVEQATRGVLDCYRQLSAQVDAMYVTTHRGVTPESVGQVAAILRDAKVPSFAMLGTEQVRAGLLMSLAETDYSANAGLFDAEVIARIFNGAKPRQLNQIWIDSDKIALNLDTTRRIGFDPPVDILLAADEVYQEGKR